MSLPEPGAALGVLPLGTGSDFSRSIGWNKLSYQEMMQRIGAMETKRVDVGRVMATPLAAPSSLAINNDDDDTNAKDDIEPRLAAATAALDHHRYFMNVASVGFTGAAADNVDKWKALGSYLAYTIAALSTFR